MCARISRALFCGVCTLSCTECSFGILVFSLAHCPWWLRQYCHASPAQNSTLTPKTTADATATAAAEASTCHGFPGALAKNVLTRSISPAGRAATVRDASASGVNPAAHAPNAAKPANMVSGTNGAANRFAATPYRGTLPLIPTISGAHHREALVAAAISSAKVCGSTADSSRVREGATRTRDAVATADRANPISSTSEGENTRHRSSAVVKALSVLRPVPRMSASAPSAPIVSDRTTDPSNPSSIVYAATAPAPANTRERRGNLSSSPTR